MNVMQRPLFRASGGEAFPDLSGDGKVTQKDILMGRGVIPRGMEEGGLAALMPAPEAAMMEEGMVDPAMMEGGPLNPAEAEFAGDLVGATQEGEQLGLGYLAQTMNGIDSASNTEELINSIRGKAQPLEARVQELATFVGEEDAMRTPESVLTMVQPVIMMTEEGAIDSGIGELMQGVMGDTEMSADMGQGVGALMAQGQPAPEMAPPPPMPAAMPPMAPPPQMAQAPMAPPQQFAAGGPVVHMAEAGDPAKKQLEAIEAEFLPTAPAETGLQGYFDEYLPIYQNLIATSEEDRAKDKALALAKAGFQFASGRDAKGQNIAGSGFLANLASAGVGFTDDIGAIEREKRKLNQGTKTLALQSAMASQKSDKETRAASNLAMFDASKDLLIEELKSKRLFTNEYGTRTVTVDGQEQSQLYVRKGPNAGETVQSGDPLFVDVAAQAFRDAGATVDGSSGGTPPATGNVTPPATGNVRVPVDVSEIGIAGLGFTEPRILNAFSENSLDEKQTNRFMTNLSRTYQPKQTPEGISLATVLDPAVAIAIVKRADKLGTVSGVDPLLVKKARQFTAGVDATTLDMFLQDQLDTNEDFFAKDFNPVGVYGTTEVVGRALGEIGDQVSENIEILSTPRSASDLKTPSAKSKRDTLAVQGLLKELVPMFARDESDGRTLAALIAAAQESVAKLQPGAGTTDKKALFNAEVTRKRLQQKYKTQEAILANPKLTNPAQVQLAKNEFAKTKQLLDAITRIETGLRASFGGPAQIEFLESTATNPNVSPAEELIRSTLKSSGVN